MTKHGEWQDLPHGGAMRSKSGMPVEVSDKGAWQLDENRILAEAQEVSGFKLTWMHLNRGQRWHKAPIFAVFRPRDERNWCIAAVSPAACESCGVQAGARWIGTMGSPDRIWVCEVCAARGVID